MSNIFSLLWLIISCTNNTMATIVPICKMFLSQLFLAPWHVCHVTIPQFLSRYCHLIQICRSDTFCLSLYRTVDTIANHYPMIQCSMIHTHWNQTKSSSWATHLPEMQTKDSLTKKRLPLSSHLLTSRQYHYKFADWSMHLWFLWFHCRRRVKDGEMLLLADLGWLSNYPNDSILSLITGLTKFQGNWHLAFYGIKHFLPSEAFLCSFVLSTFVTIS